VFFQVVKASDWLAERIVWVSFPRLICVWTKSSVVFSQNGSRRTSCHNNDLNHRR
jgi:hypothetical protein